MDFIINNWYLIIAALAVIIFIAYKIYVFLQKDNSEKIFKIKNWLLSAVILAEKQFGSKTGALKLSWVYQKFCTEIPWLAKVITFEQFSKLVDEALETMKLLLNVNPEIKKVVED